jgi:UDP-N-acetylglucosamine 2-epimerase (non-hydrolysing)
LKNSKKIFLIFGTRPEAIKMAPIIFSLKKDTNFNIKVCITAQHRNLLDQVIEIFDITVDYDLDIMIPGQNLHQITTKILLGLNNIFNDDKPDLVLVHGDTSTAFAASLACFYNKIKIGHIEAGLRTGDIYSPFPEEANRKMISVLTNFHFCPTESSKNNLLFENYPNDNIFVTGNTVIDALFMAKSKIENDKNLLKSITEKFNYINFKLPILLVTGHRRENFNNGFDNICDALLEISKERKDLQIIFPVHPNPNVSKIVHDKLGSIKNIFLIEPLEYLPFVFLLYNCKIVLTDSGGIQEEAPSFGKPVLVMRNVTERPEAVDAGTVILVGTNKKLIIDNVLMLLDNSDLYSNISFKHNPYGDGYAAEKIINHIKNILA